VQTGGENFPLGGAWFFAWLCYKDIPTSETGVEVTILIKCQSSNFRWHIIRECHVFNLITRCGSIGYGIKAEKKEKK
jgi:hypothetical protein